MSQAYIGEIRLVGFNFPPVGWALCNGQSLSIAENTTLFQLIGTTYGGDGITTFQLPNLCGRTPVHMGQRTGSSSYVLGQSGGVTSVTLTLNQLATHTHTPLAQSAGGSSATAAGQYFASASEPVYGSAGTPLAMAATTTAAGGSQLHDNMQPYIAVNYIISLYGVYPSQS